MGSELTDSVSDQPRLEDPVYEQHDNNRKENRIRADKSQYILIGKDYLFYYAEDPLRPMDWCGMNALFSSQSLDFPVSSF